LYKEKLKEAGITRSVVIVDDEVKMTVDDAHTILPSVMNIAAINNIFIKSISVQEPQMDDVFLHYTGRAIREGGSKDLGGMGAIMRRQIK